MWDGVESMPKPSTRVLENTRVSTDKSATESTEVAPVFDERDAPHFERTGVDASTFYKDAFALYGLLSDEEKRMISRPTEEVDADKAAALFEKIQPIMELLRRGAAGDFCDWGLGEPNVDNPFPQMGKSINLGKVALWNAAYRFSGDAEGAIDDLSTRARLGHHLAETLMGFLVDSSFEKSAANLLRQNAAVLNEAARGKAGAFLSASTLDRDMEFGLAGEMKFGKSAVEKFIGQTPDERVASRRALSAEGDADANARSERAEAVVRDSVLLRAEMEFVQKAQAQMLEAMSWPDPKFDAWMQQFDESHSAEHPIAATTLPMYRVFRESLQARRVEREMLNVGLAVLESGADQAGRSRDPVTGRPFVYLPKPGGFELQSAFQSKGKPLTMRFDFPK